MIKACIFDLDGVLVDTAHFHYQAWKRLAEKLNFDFSLEDNERLKGVSRMTSLDILLEIGDKQIDDNYKHELADLKNNWYVEYISKMTDNDVLPGVSKFLQELKNGGFKLGLGSASKNALNILTRTNILGFFDTIVDGNSVSKAKPDPEIFLTGLTNLKVNPDECVVFEDAVAGVEAALNAETYVVGVGSIKNLNKAHVVIPDFKEMNLELFQHFTEKYFKLK
jgi:beta-phosphoglucomutase